MEKLRALKARNEGKLPNYTFPGLYSIVYWLEEFNDIFPLCGLCAEKHLVGEYGDDWKFIKTECGAEYDDSLVCESCGIQLSDHYEDPLEELRSRLIEITHCYYEELGGGIQGIAFPNNDYFITESEDEQGAFHITNGEDNGEQDIYFTFDEVVDIVSKW